MNDKLLIEAAWRAIANKAKLKDNGLGKKLADAGRLARDNPIGCDAALSDAINLAEKLLRDKAVAANADAKKHLQGLIAAAGRERTALAVQIKAAAAQRAEAEQESENAAARLLTELARVKNGGGKTTSEFLAYPAAPVFGLVAAKRITPAIKEATRKLAGGKRLIQGRIALEGGKCTFVAEEKVVGLAKNMQKAIQAQTGKTIAVRARDTAGVAEETSEAEEAAGPRGLALEGSPGESSASAGAAASSEAGSSNRVSPVDPVDEDGEPVRPAELIAGSSGVQWSHGDNTNTTAAQGEDFADGSRANAGSGPDRDAPMQSANLVGLGGFKLRYAIGFLCADYSAVAQKFPNLGDVAQYAKPNSQYLRTFKGMNKSRQFLNPVAGEIPRAIRDWVALLAKDLPAKGQGELVVSFQGHGEHGSFYAVDGGEITKEKMLEIAREAEAKRVSITYVLDACFSGAAVSDFQDHEADAVDGRVEEFVEGEGLMSSEENHARAEVARRQMKYARKLIAFSRAISSHGDAIEHALGRLEHQKTAKNFRAVIAENNEVIKLVREMQKQFRADIQPDADSNLRLDTIGKAFNEILEYLEAIPPNGPFNPPVWNRKLGDFQDTISDGANRVLHLLDSQARGARRRTRRATQGLKASEPVG